MLFPDLPAQIGPGHKSGREMSKLTFVDWFGNNSPRSTRKKPSRIPGLPKMTNVNTGIINIWKINVSGPFRDTFPNNFSNTNIAKCTARRYLSIKACLAAQISSYTPRFLIHGFCKILKFSGTFFFGLFGVRERFFQVDLIFLIAKSIVKSQNRWFPTHFVRKTDFCKFIAKFR